MTSPTHLPAASLARYANSAGLGARTSRRPRAALLAICSVALFLIMGATPPLTNARSGFAGAAPFIAEHSSDELVRTSLVFRQPAGTISPPYNHRFQSNSRHDVHFRTTPSCNVGQSLSLDPVSAVVSPGALFLRLEMRDSGLVEPQLQFASSGTGATALMVCRGRCWDPHQGQFRYWNGQQNGCWIQVWRSWPDGCSHFQWYNSCNGYWDTHPNGAPKVYWSCCVH